MPLIHSHSFFCSLDLSSPRGAFDRRLLNRIQWLQSNSPSLSMHFNLCIQFLLMQTFNRIAFGVWIFIIKYFKRIIKMNCAVSPVHRNRMRLANISQEGIQIKSTWFGRVWFRRWAEFSIKENCIHRKSFYSISLWKELTRFFVHIITCRYIFTCIRAYQQDNKCYSMKIINKKYSFSLAFAAV